MECLKVLCLVMCFLAVCSQTTRHSTSDSKNNPISQTVVMVPLNKKMAKSDVSYNNFSKQRSGKAARVGENKTTIVNGVLGLLQNIGINLSTKQSNKLYNFIPYPLSGPNTVYKILIYPKNCTRPNTIYVLPDGILKNKTTPKKHVTQDYGNDDESTHRIVLLDEKEYKIKNALLEKSLTTIPDVEHGSVQSGKTAHIKDVTH